LWQKYTAIWGYGKGLRRWYEIDPRHAPLAPGEERRDGRVLEEREGSETFFS